VTETGHQEGEFLAGSGGSLQDRDMGELTQLLEAVRDGEGGAVDQVFALTYAELRDLAHQRIRRSSPVTVLDTTSLVHECYLRLVRLGQLNTKDRAHFLAYSARVMRSIVVDLMRQRLALRRGGDDLRVTLATDMPDAATFDGHELLRVNDALEELAQLDPRLVQVVEMKYFAGLSVQEIAEALGVAERTVNRDWEKARLLLFNALQNSS
jgi:RNA polymerase sigma factor (TIGR02999 family)